MSSLTAQLMSFRSASPRIEFQLESWLARIIFGPEDSEPILGAMALEYDGFNGRPSSQTLNAFAAGL